MRELSTTDLLAIMNQYGLRRMDYVEQIADPRSDGSKPVIAALILEVNRLTDLLRSRGAPTCLEVSSGRTRRPPMTPSDAILLSREKNGRQEQQQ